MSKKTMAITGFIVVVLALGWVAFGKASSFFEAKVQGRCRTLAALNLPCR